MDAGGSEQRGMSAPTAWLGEFRALLLQGDVEARELWEQERSSVGERLSIESTQRISRALENFEFDIALRLIDDALATQASVQPEER